MTHFDISNRELFQLSYHLQFHKPGCMNGNNNVNIDKLHPPLDSDGFLLTLAPFTPTLNRCLWLKLFITLL